MIDCAKTGTYFAEKRRMTKRHKLNDGVYICKLDCTICPLSCMNNDAGISCSDFETNFPEKAIVIVQKWSDRHPPKTYLTELLENYPNAPLEENGTPVELCPSSLGLKEIKDCNSNCVECWNQPLREEKE